MTSYITITDAETDPSAPLTSELAKKWRDNTVAIAEKDTSVPTGLRLGYWPLGTINTTSGSSQTLSGLVLTNYTALFLEVRRVIPNSSLTNYSIRLNSTTGPQISNNYDGTGAWYGTALIMLGEGIFSSSIAAAGQTAPVSGGAGTFGGDCNITNASTSITVALSNNSFTSGSVLVYGVR